jgi:uncharacterized protein
MYEWDEEKNQKNESKHGISFEVAVEVFSDANAVIQFNRNIDGEIRDQIIGSLANEIIVLFVVFTNRREKIRLISARKANKRERAIYEKQTTSN